jgi:glycosyltransferase involved in cell wall biosynthesis
MRILLVPPRFPSVPDGGAENHVFNLAKYLTKRGMEVSVFTSDVQRINLWQLRKTLETKTKDEILNGFRVRRFYAPVAINGYVPLARFFQYLTKERFDIVHAHGYHYFSTDVASAVARIKKRPFLLTLHGLIFRNSYYDRTLGKCTLRTANAIIGVSKSDVLPLLRYDLVKKDRIKIIPNAIDMESFDLSCRGSEFRQRFNIDPAENVILYVGRLADNKGLTYLLDSVPKVIRKNPYTLFVLVGEDWGMKKDLEKQAERMGITKYVIYTGKLAPRMLQKAFASCDVYVFPSLFEAFGITLLEAMAFGKPIVATRIDGIIEVVKDGSTGLLVEARNSEELSSAINSILSDSALGRRLGQNGRKCVEAKYTWDAIGAKIFKLYEDLLSSD